MKFQSNKNIKSLKDKRQLNVQERIVLRKHEMFSEAIFWRENGLPKPIEVIFKENGIDLTKSIVINYEQDYPGISTYVGIVVTQDFKFYEFDADLSIDRAELEKLNSFIDVSDRFEINMNKKGVGETDGAIAINVLKNINQTCK